MEGGKKASTSWYEIYLLYPRANKTTVLVCMCMFIDITGNACRLLEVVKSTKDWRRVRFQANRYNCLTRIDPISRRGRGRP